MHRLILALGVVAIMSFGGRPGGGQVSAAQVSVARAAIPQPIYFWSTVVAEITGPGRSPLPEVIRPSVIVLAPDGHWYIEQLHWTGWGTSVAHAQGISNASNGIPSMASGKRIKKPAQVTLSSPGPFNGHELYRCFTLTIPTLSAADQHLCLKVTGGSAWLWPTTTTPIATKTATPTNATPVGAVRLLVGDGSSGRVGACSDAGGWSPAHGCPITGRLQHRLLQHPTEGRGGGADPICRCQNSAPTTLRLHDMHGATAHVNVRWAFNPPNTITFAVLQRGSRWLVDDMYIAACPQSTSIYTNPSFLTCNGNG
jgi:hypothetical protein